MLAVIEMHYTTDGLIKAMTPEQRQLLRDEVPGLCLSEEGKTHMHSHGTFLADLSTAGPLLIELGLQFAVKRSHSCYRVSGAPSGGVTSVTNTQLAIPNLLLLEVDEVSVIEDACTDQLQGRLDEGWRILAACPPAAARRPDYVLGRSKNLGRGDR